MILEGLGDLSFAGRSSGLDCFADVPDDRSRGCEVAVSQIQQPEAVDFDGFDPLHDRDGRRVTDPIMLVFTA